MNPIVLLVGDINVDVLQRLPRFPEEGEEKEIESLEIRAGGAAFNVAKVLGRYKITPFIVASIGNDVFGEFLLRECEELNIPTAFIQKKAGRTGMVFSINTQRDRTMFTLRGANKELSDPETVYHIMEKSNLIYFSSYAFIEGKQRETAIRILHHARKLERSTVLSISLLSIKENRKEIMSLLDSFDLIFMNEREYEELFDGKEFGTLNLGHAALVVTRGERGAIYHSKDIVREVDSSTLKEGYLLGAGDAFVGGFIAGLLLHSDVLKGLEVGSKAASDWIK